jgi:hypothetical protein
VRRGSRRRRVIVVLATSAVFVAAAATATPAQALPEPVPCDGCWVPELETSWQWQLQGRIDTSFDVEMYDVDAFECRGGSSTACTIRAPRSCVT